MYRTLKGHPVLTVDDILEDLKTHTRLKQALPAAEKDLRDARRVRVRLRTGLRRRFVWRRFLRLLALSTQIRELATAISKFKEIDKAGSDPRTGSWWPSYMP